MVEKLVGKVKYYHDPELISYNNNGAVFFDRSSQGKINGTLDDFYTFFTLMAVSGWGILFLGVVGIITDYLNYTFISTEFQGRIQISILLICVFIAFVLFIINKLFTKQFQTAMRGKMFGLMYPLTAGWRALHKKNGDMSAKVEGIQNKQVFTFFLKQYVCADIELEGDFKTQLEDIEWTNGSYMRLPAHIKAPLFVKRSFGLFLLVLALFGDYGNTRKIRIYFKQPPQDGYMRIETF